MPQQGTQSITLGGKTYPVSGLSRTALDAAQSLLFSEMRIRELQAEIAINRAAHLSFLQMLKADLVKLSVPTKT